MYQEIFKSDESEVYFYGYYTNKQIHTNDNIVLCHHVEKDTGFVRVGFFDFRNTSKFQVIGKTNAYNWQQGSQLQWLDNDKVIFNNLEKNRVFSEIRSVDGKLLEKSGAFYAINQNIIAEIDYNRHAIYRKAYSYNIVPKINSIGLNFKDYINIIDLSGKFKRKIFAEEIFTKLNTVNFDQIDYNTFEHLQFSPDSLKLAFLFRLKLKSGSLKTYLCSYDRSLNSIKIWNVKSTRITHYNWINDEKIIAWCGSPTSANWLNDLLSSSPLIRKPLKTFYKMISFGDSEKGNSKISGLFTGDSYKVVTSNAIIESLKFPNSDGHPTYMSTIDGYLTDTYPDSNFVQKLLILDRLGNVLFIDKIKSDPDIARSSNRCDLHPRLSKSEKLISIDFSEFKGTRGIKIYEKI